MNTKFLGLQIDNHINLKNHVEQMIPKLSSAHYAIRSTVHVGNMNTLKSVYFAYFQSGIKYNFLCNSSNSGETFTLQKQMVRITAAAQPRTSCRSLFKQLETLPVLCQYILLLMSFIINNQEIFQTDSSMYNINTRNKHHHHRPNANLPFFKKKYILCWHKNFPQLNHPV